ncbi:hypothetical protein SAMN04487934_10818 [Eubacterium ruminantium]|nr:hypothetical protein SAMN04487934_10818 [Eubacterium ruminantium]
MAERKWALITGATGGIGYEFVKIFAKKGYDLILVARNEKRLYSIKKKLESFYDTKVLYISKDLSETGAAEDVFRKVKEKNIFTEVLVNNAGFGDFGFFAESDLNKQENMINCNILALTALTRLFMTDMIEEGRGKILNVASIGSFMPGPCMSVYYATKAYVLSFTEALSVELKGTGVSVTALCPGPTDTGFWKAANTDDTSNLNNLKNASPRKVAGYGYKKMMRKKVIAVPGFLTGLAPLGIKLLPRPAVRKIVYKVQKMK